MTISDDLSPQQFVAAVRQAITKKAMTYEQCGRIAERHLAQWQHLEQVLFDAERSVRGVTDIAPNTKGGTS